MKKIFWVIFLGILGFTTVQAQNTNTTTKQTPTAPKQTSTAPKQALTETKKPSAAPVEVPDVVKNKFTADYSSAKDVKWKRDGKNFEGSYMDNGKKVKAVYSAEGALVRSTKEIEPSALPKPANDYILKTYPGQSITYAEQANNAKGEIKYEAKVGTNKLLFDASGNFIAPKNKMEPKKEPMKTEPKK